MYPNSTDAFLLDEGEPQHEHAEENEMITAEEAQRDQDELDRLALDKLIEDYRHTAHWLLRLQSHPAVVAPDAEVALTHVSNVFCQAILGYLP